MTSANRQKNVYLLSADNSKLDSLNIQGLRDAQFDQLSWEQKRWAFRELLQSQLIEGHQPPYYLAAAWSTPAQTGTAGATSQVSVTMEKAG